jgi:hypothetical protein
MKLNKIEAKAALELRTVLMRTWGWEAHQEKFASSPEVEKVAKTIRATHRRTTRGVAYHV